MSNEPTFPRTVLFVDARHIATNDLRWYSPDGQQLPVAGPPESANQAFASLAMIPRGIRLEAQKAQKSDPLPAGTRLTRVIQDGGCFRTWHLDIHYGSGRDLGSYAREYPVGVDVVYQESEDGFQWAEKKRSPLLVQHHRGFDGFTYLIDPHAPSAERYKIIYGAIPPDEDHKRLWQQFLQIHPVYRDGRLKPDKLHALYMATSPDGLEWTPHTEPLMVHQSDTDTTVFWDEWLQRYIMYTRLYFRQRRSIGIAESPDSYQWGPVRSLIEPRLEWGLTDDIYLNAYSPYPTSPSYRMMFPMVYHRYDQTSDVRMYASDNALTWQELPGGPVITPGEPGSWDAEFIHAGKDLVMLDSERIALPYHGTPYPHKYPRWKSVSAASRVAWAWWPKGRLAAVVADQEGEFYTFASVPPGRTLRLNANIRYGGEIRVGIMGIEGRSASDCAPIGGNGYDLPVVWNGETDIAAPVDTPITLHFKMRAAHLFGLEWV
jgi:hypothetical protein